MTMIARGTTELEATEEVEVVVSVKHVLITVFWAVVVLVICIFGPLFLISHARGR